MGYEPINFVNNHVLRRIIVLSSDIVICIGLTSVAVLGSLATTGILRKLLILPVLLFLPGYAIVSGLFPESIETTTAYSPSMGTRVALAFGVSFSLLPLLGILLSVSGIGFSISVVLESLGTIIVLSSMIAGKRRAALPSNNRFHVPFDHYFHRFKRWLYPESGLKDGFLNTVLLIVIVVAVSALLFGIMAPPNTASYSSFSLLTEDASGELVAGNYPTTLSQGEPSELVLAVENNERQSHQYTVIVELQQFDRSSSSVTERVELNRFSEEVSVGSTWRPRVQLEPQIEGTELRAAFYLYTGEPPQEPTVDSSNEHLYLWVNATQSDQSGQTTESTTLTGINGTDSEST